MLKVINIEADRGWEYHGAQGGGVVFKLGGGWYFRVVIHDWFILWRSLTSFERDWLSGKRHVRAERPLHQSRCRSHSAD